jgi:hypothetical protein
VFSAEQSNSVVTGSIHLSKSEITGARSKRRPDKASGIPCCAAWKKHHPRLFPSNKSLRVVYSAGGVTFVNASERVDCPCVSADSVRIFCDNTLMMGIWVEEGEEALRL